MIEHPLLIIGRAIEMDSIPGGSLRQRNVFGQGVPFLLGAGVVHVGERGTIAPYVIPDVGHALGNGQGFQAVHLVKGHAFKVLNSLGKDDGGHLHQDPI